MRLLSAALVLLSTACSPPPEDGSRIRLALMARLTHAPGLTGVHSGRFARALAEVALEPQAFEVGNSVVEAMFAREIDVAYLGPNPAINGFVRSGGRDVVIVAGAATGGAAFVVRKGAGINAPADLRGKRIATPQIASTQDIALRSYLSDHGLSSTLDGGDVTVLPLEPPFVLSLFASGEIDGAWVSEPLTSQLLANEGARVFVDEADEWPGGRYLTTVLAVRRDYLEAAPDVVDHFVGAHAREVQWIEAHRSEALYESLEAMDQIARRRLDPAVAGRAWERIHFTDEAPTNMLLRAARNAERAGFLPPRNLSDLVETGPRERAR
jgi:NitT/TauT family transport system substrate-binding protein